MAGRFKWLKAVAQSLFVGAAGLYGSVCVAQTPNGGISPTEYMAQAVARTLVTARAADTLGGYGFAQGTSFLGGFLKVDRSATLVTTLNAGEQYMLLAAGDDDARDVDVILRRESSGAIVASDTDSSAGAVVFFTPNRTDRYTIEVKLHDSSAYGSFVSAAILSRNGTSVPIDRLAEASAGLLQRVEVSRLAGGLSGLGVGFNAGDGQWAVFGAVLRPGEHTRIYNNTLGPGSRLFIASGDGRARDVDLFIDNNNEQRVLWQDIDDDATPVIHQFTTPGRYGIRYKLVRSYDSRPSFVMVAVLELR